MAIEKKFSKSASKVVLYGVSFLQKWEILLKDGDRSKLKACEGPSARDDLQLHPV